MAGLERRKHERVKLDRAVTVRDGAGTHDGTLVDISLSGAAVNLDDDDFYFDSDQDIEMDMEDFGILTGSVVRILDDGFAMAFDLNEDSEERLITEISGYRSGSDIE
ncbi:MAG: PilZ domain-containing protein [Alphaproteobacteria bacterium]